MYCIKCGRQNDDSSYKCEACGAVLLHVGAGESSVRIPNYLVQSILVTLFCCLPLGIPAIIYAAQVNSQIRSGDLSGAMDSSRKAKLFCGLSVCLIFVLWALYLLLAVVVATGR